MDNVFIGRKTEQRIIANSLESGKAEFVAVYGRRRIGKTFLIRNFFNSQFDFFATGLYNGTKQEQLRNFNEQLQQYSKRYYAVPDNWHDAFLQLRDYLSSFNKSQVIVFLDELPWFDTKNSRFLRELDYFWNSWAVGQPSIKLFVCGSATTWMFNRLIGDKGGLHNRITRSIRLSPFTLRETEDYLKTRMMDWDRYTILESYMTFGGIPYYLSMLERGLSLTQNIDQLFYSPSGELRHEFSFLFRSLFNDSQRYIQVIQLLSKKAKGLTREEIQRSLNLKAGGNISEVLHNLETCDFIRRYHSFGKKERNALYQLTDLYTLFYLRFVNNDSSQDEHFWSNMLENPERRTWSGYAFEQVCLHHLSQIKLALGISGILTSTCSWTGGDEEQKTQIDLVIDRRDRMINLCEMKYAQDSYELTKSYRDKLVSRRELFRKVTKTTKGLSMTMVTPYGIKANKYSDIISKNITMDDLFKD